MKKLNTLFIAFLVILGIPYISQATIIDLNWSKTLNYAVDSTRGSSSKFYNDPYWNWTSGDSNVWNAGNSSNPFANWGYYGTYSHFWFKGTFNLPSGSIITDAFLKDLFSDPINGYIPINDNMYVWVNDSPTFLAYGGTTYFYRWGHSDSNFNTFSNYSNGNRGDQANPANGWQIAPLNLSSANWNAGLNTIYILTEDDSLFGAMGKMQLDANINSVPEPTTSLLLSSGLIALIGIRKKIKMFL